MITYNWMCEVWEDDEDEGWNQDYTPECEKDCEKKFKSRKDFLKWYRGDDEK